MDNTRRSIMIPGAIVQCGVRYTAHMQGQKVSVQLHYLAILTSLKNSGYLFQVKSSFQQLSNLFLVSLALSVPGVLTIAMLIL